MMELHGPKLLGSSYQDPISSYDLFQKFSVQHPEVFWSIMVKELSISFQQAPRSILDTSDKLKDGGKWFPGAVLNIAECCLLPVQFQNKTDDSVAIVWRDENYDDFPVKCLSLKEFRDQVMIVANALDTVFTKGDAIAIDMPMTCTAVIIYLAIILAGYVVVSIADSFAPKEIGTRVDISKAKGIFTQDFIIRGGKKFPLYSRVVAGTKCKAIVIPAIGTEMGVQLRGTDMSWKEFLSHTAGLPRPYNYSPIYQPAENLINILFSSGTTGEPKAVPWTQLSPIRCASDSWAHLDVQPGDIFCWPTNLGWVMGPIMVYSSFLNGATLALYHGSPLGRGFGKFIQDAGVTMLGTVPSLVKTWKSSKCMEGLDWTKIRVFGTTGEASDIDDDLWLSSRSFYKPVIECCGELNLHLPIFKGACCSHKLLEHLALHPCQLDLSSLMNKGLLIGRLVSCVPGATDRLLNADHKKVYFDGMPTYNGMKLRRHGDIIQRTVGGYYLVQGRADDTMNLGGIKTSSLEIERVCNRADESVLETAAVSIKSSNGGPEQLVILAVLNKRSAECDPNLLKAKFQRAIQKNLNPLFKVSFVKVVPEFPRTASNKLLRRVLRDQVKQEFSTCSKL
uniref:4-coumarate--CoA ligase n=1 Tax=Ananas comosus var. bracteatus TaxID=296719 RepID=A0A6V7NIK1_ANACO|nr:unnamed protein product [Ananas comosus var. bracteatus]